MIWFLLPRKIVILIIVMIHFNTTYDDSVSQYVSVDTIIGSSEVSESSDSEVIKLACCDNAGISHCY